MRRKAPTRTPRGSASTSWPSTTGGARPSRSAARSNSSAWAGRPISSRVKSSRFCAVGGEHRLGRANEKGVDQAIASSRGRIAAACGGSCASDTRRALPSGGGPASAAATFAPVGRLRSDHLVAHRMDEAGGDKIGGVERLVGDRAIGPRAESAHHRGRDVARTGPHRDAHDGAAALIGRSLRLPRPPAPCRARPSRRVIGPEASTGARGSSPIVRPSTGATGVKPGEGARGERLVGAIDVEQRKVLLERRNALAPGRAQAPRRG